MRRKCFLSLWWRCFALALSSKQLQVGADINWIGVQISLDKVVHHRSVPQASLGRHRAAGRNGPSQSRHHVEWAASVIPCLKNGECTTLGRRSMGRSHTRT